MGDSYYIYLVDDDCISKEGYEPIIICNPAKVIFESEDWLIESDSYRIARIIGRPVRQTSSSISKPEQDEQEELEEEISPRYVSDSRVFFNRHNFTDTDLLRVFNAMQEAGFFVDEVGTNKRDF